MKRQLSNLEHTQFDVLVIGGGVVGACAAWDAALRGLRVALIERGDFASEASSNSLKIIHGGLRYLQHFDIRRMRDSIRERSTWLRIAPHLVEPLPVLIPAYRQGLQRKSLLRIALAVNDAISWNRNRDLQSDRHLPAARALSRAECLELVPELEPGNPTGGVLFYDAQMYNSERLVLELVQAAEGAGAVVANYVEFEVPLLRGKALVGAGVRDVIGGDRIDVRASVILNAAGHLSGSIAERLVGGSGATSGYYSLALNVAVPGRGHRVAFAIRGSGSDPDAMVKVGSRQFLFVPWRGRLLIGTGHYAYTGEPADFRLQSDDVARFVEDVNGVWPGSPVDPSDIVLVHSGLIPVQDDPARGEVSFLKRHRIIDHASDGIPNALTAITGKYTTARSVAQDVVDRVAGKLGREPRACRTGVALLPGATETPVSDVVDQASRKYGDQVDRDVLEHLVRTHGGVYEGVLDHRHEIPDWDLRPVQSEPVIKAQWIHAIREELAVLPEDLVWRRTELGARGIAPDEVLRLASETLAAERDSAG